MSAPRPLTLATFVEAHSSHFASDKLIKTVGYLAGVLSVVLKKLHGQDDSRAVGLAQVDLLDDQFLGLRVVERVDDRAHPQVDARKLLGRRGIHPYCGT